MLKLVHNHEQWSSLQRYGITDTLKSNDRYTAKLKTFESKGWIGTLHSKFLNRNSDGCLPRFIETDDAFGHINQLENFMSDKNFADQ